MDKDICVSSVLLPIHHSSEREYLVGRQLHLVVIVNLIAEYLLQFLVDGIRCKVLVLDFILDILLLVGLIMVFVVGSFFDITQMNQLIQGFVDVVAQSLEVGIQGREHQFGDVICRRWESLDVLDEEECLQYLEGKLIVQRTFCLLDVALNLGLQDATQSLVHIAELYDVVEVLMGIYLCHFLGDGEQTSFAHTLLFSAEGIVLREFDDAALYQVKLVVDERKVDGKLLVVLIVALKLAVVAKVEERLDDMVLLLIYFAKHLLRLLFLLQQASLNHLVGIGTGETDTGIEATLDSGEIVFLLFVEIAECGINVHLRGYNHDTLSVGLVRQAFGDGLKTEHSMHVFSDKLSHLINEEDESAAWLLLVEVLFNQGNESVGINLVVGNLCLDIIEGGCLGDTINFSHDFCHTLKFEKDAFSAVLPGFAKSLLVFFLEELIFSLVVEISFYLSNLRFLVIVSHLAVEFLDEDVEHRVDGTLGGGIQFFLNIEEYALGRNAACFLDVATKFEVFCLGGKDFCAWFTINLILVFKNVREYFQKVRLTATEVARNPGTLGFLGWHEGMEELWQLLVLLLFGSDDKFRDFYFQFLDTVCLDNAIDGAVDIFLVNVLLFHCYAGYDMMSLRFCPR